MMPKIKIAFLEVQKWEEKYLKNQFKKNNDISISFFSKPLNRYILKKIKSIDILASFINPPLDAKTLRALPRLKFIATMSTGFDHIDLKECKRRGIKVSNVPLYGTNTVAEHTFALILALSRRIPESISRTRRGDFSLKNLRGFDLKGKTLGIIGLGHIGSHTARLARGFQMKVLALDPKKDLKLAQKWKVKYVSLEYLLAHSDIITLHAPYNETSHHLINKSTIKKIKPGAYLINTARGGLVDTEALLLALKKKILAGAALDVLEEECFIKEERELLSPSFHRRCNLKTVLQNHLLLQQPNVLVTPHNAFNSQEALQRILDTTINNIKAFLKGKPIHLVTHYDPKDKIKSNKKST